MSVMLLVFCAASSVSSAATLAGFSSFTAVMKLKMLVKAGVARWSLMRTLQIAENPRATLSLASALLSYRSHSTDHTVDSLHQQPTLPEGEPGGLVDGLVST